jgi:hypothetical protein
MNKCFGNYLGLVVNTTDPEKRGRVQVFVPNITPTLYKDWNETAKNKSFKTFESKSFSAEIKDRLQKHLPWAEAAVPFWGGSTGAPSNASTGTPTPIPTDQGFNYIYPEEGAGGGRISQQHNGDRSGDLGSDLQGVIARGLSGTGLNWVSYSGTGSTAGQAENSQHLFGKATDGYFTESVYPYRKLDPTTSEEDKGRIAYALYKLTQAGIGGIGYGPGYMGGTTNFHLDVGDPNRNWGRSFTSSSATPWVVQARSGIGVDPSITPSTVPTEAYADTRDVEIDALADPQGRVTGDTEKIGSASDILSEIRSMYGEDLANPETLNTIYGLIKSEVGNQNDAAQLAFVETLFNRSYVQNDTLTDTVNTRAYFGVYSNGSYDAARSSLTQAEISKYNSLIQQALQGSNVSNGSAHAGQYGDPGIDPNGIYEAIDSTKVEIDGEVFYNKTTQLDQLGKLAEVSGDASLITNGQNVIRTRIPDAYGSLAGPRTGGTMGFNSVPHVGSKVWVFFMGGDVQKPVYFATIYEPNNIA